VDTVSPMRVRILITYGLAVFIAAWLVWGVSNRVLRVVLSAGTTLAAIWVLKELPTFVVVWTLPFILTPVIWAALSRAERSQRLDATALSLRQAAAVAAVVAISAPVALVGGLGLARWNLTPAGAVHPEWNTAQRMIRDGIPVGSKVAVVGNPENSGWARLARYQIVAVVPQHRADAFWKLNDADRARIMRAFSEAGATRLITLPSSPVAFRDGFQPK
jgi:hypothetical protein